MIYIITFLDLFAGIGGFRIGMEMAGHKCLGFCENDKFAIRSYNAMFDTKGEWFENDIRKIKTIPKADCWCFGFPCTDISIAGSQAGLKGTKSGLFFEVTNLIRISKKEIKPHLLFIENVKNLLFINKGFDFLKILIELDEIGYDAEWAVINSSDVVPQHRERVFIIGHLRGKSRREIFPIRRKTQNNFNERKIKQAGIYTSLNNYNFISRKGRIYQTDGISPCLTKMQGGYQVPIIPVSTASKVNSRSNGRRFKTNNEPMFTLTTQDVHGIFNGKSIRKLTPLECFRLQGFPDTYFYKAASVNSNSQLYKQIGNSVTVPVIYEIAKKLI